jgi:hypothetical protein
MRSIGRPEGSSLLRTTCIGVLQWRRSAAAPEAGRDILAGTFLLCLVYYLIGSSPAILTALRYKDLDFEP